MEENNSRTSKIRRHANDRAPTIEEILKICEYPDRRIKGIVYTMASSGIRLGTWDYLQWKDTQPIERQGKIVAAKIIVYPLIINLLVYFGSFFHNAHLSKRLHRSIYLSIYFPFCPRIHLLMH
jgi:hypothetical protein